MQGAGLQWLITMRSTTERFFLTPRSINSGCTILPVLTSPFGSGIWGHGPPSFLYEQSSAPFPFKPTLLHAQPPSSCLRIWFSSSNLKASRLTFPALGLCLFPQTSFHLQNHVGLSCSPRGIWWNFILPSHWPLHLFMLLRGSYQSWNDF